MFVSPSEPFKIIYSLFEHQYLGFLVESFVVKLNYRNEVTFQCQNVSSKNISEFASGLDELDYELVKLIDNIQQEVIFKKFNTKKITQHDFFSKVFDTEKGDKLLKENILTYIETHKKQIFSRIKSKNFFVMGNDGVPTWKSIEIKQEPARAYFHFERQENQTVYYPIIKCGADSVKFQFKNAKIINDLPACMLLDSTLYLFDQYADGKKIKPFLDKPNIIIPKKIEEMYYQKFIVPLVANFNVFAKGFEIVNKTEDAEPQLLVSEIKNVKTMDLFGSQIDSEENTDTKLFIDLSFNYGEYNFRYDNFSAPSHVFLEKKNDSWIFYKLKKDLEKEKNTITSLKSNGLDLRNGRLSLPKVETISWFQEHTSYLEDQGIKVVQINKGNIQYFLGYSKIELKIEEKNDWFDVHAFVQFGEFIIPFLKLRKYIINNIKEFELPDGKIAIIPISWFTKYSELFHNLELDENENQVLKKHQIGLVYNLEKEGLAVTVMSRKLQTLRDFAEIEEIALPKFFKGKLRPYQKAGYDWLHFLKSFNFGGCLADDMGLGKTVTTLAFLQKLKEEHDEYPSLIVMPTSLIYNWQKEATKFTPKLKILIHFGPNRSKDANQFKDFDLVICSYGILRLDVEFIRKFKFNYTILDESQAIKNPSSIIFQSVMLLNSTNRLILTGTPLENSTLDLWSQISFINPGLLGTERFFKNHYQHQIEKLKDEITLQKLFSKIKPFLLRRHKSQVAKDLPEKIETVQYCHMTGEQEKLYEETKSYIRNQLINEKELKQANKSNILILQGLNKLRQIANNPKMVDVNFIGESGKDNDVMFKLMDVVEEGYKTLVFSQYVKHLSLIRAKLDAANVPYLYLDGSTTHRQDLVDEFQNNPSKKVFLISLKAGGVGLNLTAAEYVFILDPWWNPAIEAQAIDRAHRIGQKNTVFSYKFISKNTIEEKILDLQNSKKQLFNDLITTEDSFMKSLSEKDILSLLD